MGTAVSTPVTGTPDSFAREKAKPRKTIGERLHHAIEIYGFAGLATFISGVAITYFVKDTAPLKSWADKAVSWTHNKTGVSKKVLDDALITTTLFTGGNLLLFPVRWMQKNQHDIVHKLNGKFGREQDVIDGDKNVSEKPPANWGEIIKARMLAWVTVFGALTAAGAIAPKQMGQFKDGGSRLFQNTSEKIAGLFGKTPTEKTQQVMGKLGDYSAVDFFATVAASTLLDYGMRLFTRNKAGDACLKQMATQPPATISMQGDVTPQRNQAVESILSNYVKSASHAAAHLQRQSHTAMSSVGI